MNEKLAVKVAYDWFSDRIRFLVCIKDFDGRTTACAQPLTMKIGEVFQETFTLPKESAQALMDGLWECGLRPTEGSGSAGALAATQRHLEDMRLLAFKNVASE